MSSLKRNWDDDDIRFKKKFTTRIYCPKKKGYIKITTICEGYVYGTLRRMRINRWRSPVIDPWMLKCNLLLQRNNDGEQWMDRLKWLGYQYAMKTIEVEELYQPRLREMINTLASGFMKRNDGMHIEGLMQIVSRYIDSSIVVFEDVLDPQFGELISGFMKNGEVYIGSVGIHKLVEQYIDKQMFDYLRWDSTCSLGIELLNWDTNYAVKGESEISFEDSKGL